MNEAHGGWFTPGQIAGFVGLLVLGAALGVGSYQAGQRLAGTGGGAVVAAASSAATPDGRVLYAGSCAGCHGANAEGAVGPALKVALAWSAADFRHAVLDGKAPEGRTLGVVMPRFAATGLDGAPPTDAQMDAIRAYLTTLP
ncbi:c-type cytochrome [Deinococcus xianganensis]|uniref:C-type cytochrome n=1 Tax=Deinococcus xianganensis TaxID=1507289 RepID=A0A6I4YFE5_9DEIO|nr:cytochrome c [Deinococcus xianganensis]MXV18731.1 c-type cytochrome [Deinococcus xianganensis]